MTAASTARAAWTARAAGLALAAVTALVPVRDARADETASELEAPAPAAEVIGRPFAPPPAGAPSWLALEPGDDWSLDPAVSGRLTAELRRVTPLASEGADAGVLAYAGPAALYLSWVSGPGGAAEIRRAFDFVRASRLRADPGGHLGSTPEAGATAELAWDEEAGGDLARFALRWRHLGNATITASRGVGLVADGAARIAWAECITAADAPPAAAAACDRALAALAPTHGVDRAAFALPAGAPPAADAPEPGPATAAPADQLRAPAEGDHAVLYQGPPSRRDPSNRWLIIAGGLLLIVAFIVASRRRAVAGPVGTPDAAAAPPEDRP